jgi:uncharacterized membrane protein
MTLESSRTIGGIGAILMLIGIFPYLSYFGIVELIGAILVLVGLYGLSGYFRESGIFKNALIGIAAGVVGVVIAAVVGFTVVLANITPLLHQIYPGWDGNWSSLQGMTPDPDAFTSGNFDPSTLLPLVTGLIAVLAILWIFAIIAAYFVRRSLKQLSARSNVGLFGTAGTLLLIGAFLTIIFIGFILMWIAAILLAIAFFQLKHPEPDLSQPPPPPPPTTI